MAHQSVQVPGFSKIFLEHVNELERRALKAGSSLTAVCRDLGISRATPDRWRRKNPRTIAILEEMERHVSTIEKRKGTDLAEA